MEQYNINDIVSQSIMTKVPTIIVEGIDDIQVYEDISKSANVRSHVVASELISPFKSGCVGVTELMESIEQMPSSRYTVSDYVVGIIDKDIRDYRGEIEEKSCLFPLKYYSMESHYICCSKILSLVSSMTKVNSRLLNDNLCEHIKLKINSSLERLYLASLEALAASLIRGYQGEITYSGNIGRVYCDDNMFGRIESKKDFLLNLANENDICFSLDSMRKFVKGKWLLESYIKALELSIKNLSHYCGEDLLDTCDFCISEVEGKCSYATKETLSAHSIRALIMKDVDSDNFNYIRDKFKTLVN
ncbi:TPA: DUF4435 domain-containing protein [Vibrio parahaemolyticus]|uniref:DUF4435 domain-containing protein n=3 Tax=Vibrio parahaemolyticus TaxID=670 RepID=UPI001869CF74|nr:DUF4435 domain-containing protein [Vibrio parahaemolyticus]EGQ9299298.1 DUF4435 domain-containing protein [Vibrio parahaemolyticus]EHR0802323.1 DUF4435 domain-containing protein [Vibrio parahaemolyticus]EJB8541975.1 DUF4435 domain-containing protein [Vibrio parahaemolyticus]MBE3825524.1 DUF4435 domain-containing protein [Vibrio parahaemolyticus]MBE4007725.1 DUF4435 domain-containing protein [Vibrio parahaemolyticus]